MNVLRTLQHLLWVVPLCAACSTLNNRTQALETSLNAYEKAMRWGQYETLPLLTSEKEREHVRVEELKKIRVSGYEARALHLGPDHKHAQQQVEIKYNHADQMSIKTLIDEQEWEYDKATHAWLRSNPLLEFP